MLNLLEITNISTCCTKVQWCRALKHAIVPATDRGGGDPVADNEGGLFRGRILIPAFWGE